MTIAKLSARVNTLLDSDYGSKEETLPGLFLLRESAPTEFEATIYEPIVCLILQGEKETTVGDRVFTVSEGHCIVVSHDLPVMARITKASPRTPYLAIVIRLDLAVLRSLYDEVGDTTLGSDISCSMEVAPVDDPTVDVIGRYLNLLSHPVEAQVLLPLVRKELHFRLYMSESGMTLRSLLRRDSHASHISRAISMLRANFRQSLAVVDLAKAVGMSTSAFHKHFKMVTMTTPLQYQKDLRLTEARRLLRSGQSTVSAAAFEVGYESPSQFSREYTRRFGATPSSEIQPSLVEHTSGDAWLA
ncbi:MAG: AraC family transcriptional regulator [Myxococcota bacterium]